MTLSRGEYLLRAFVKRILPEYKAQYNVRNLGIINKKTNYELEIDIYIPALKVGFEFNGMQHHHEEQREKDKIKQRFCKNNNITLITIWTNTLDKNLFVYLSEKYPEIPFKKPPRTFLEDFNFEIEKYKKNIKKMNKKLKPYNSFVNLSKKR